MGEDLKEQLLKRRIAEREVPIEGVGTIRVRGLSRAEVFSIQEHTDPIRFEAELLAVGMVDPKMTVDEVLAWQEAAPAGELEPVGDAIKDLSALGSVAEKAAMLRFRDDAGA